MMYNYLNHFISIYCFEIQNHNFHFENFLLYIKYSMLKTAFKTDLMHQMNINVEKDFYF